MSWKRNMPRHMQKMTCGRHSFISSLGISANISGMSSTCQKMSRMPRTGQRARKPQSSLPAHPQPTRGDRTVGKSLAEGSASPRSVLPQGMEAHVGTRVGSPRSRQTVRKRAGEAVALLTADQESPGS